LGAAASAQLEAEELFPQTQAQQQPILRADEVLEPHHRAGVEAALFQATLDAPVGVAHLGRGLAGQACIERLRFGVPIAIGTCDEQVMPEANHCRAGASAFVLEQNLLAAAHAATGTFTFRFQNSRARSKTISRRRLGSRCPSSLGMSGSGFGHVTWLWG